ncbi:MAG: methyltransferase domain-containing protein [Vicinamibacterales bacterium]
MQRALLDLLACPYCQGPLTCHVHAERPASGGVDGEIDEGLLLCAACPRWYPITGQLPEILPDHLRDAARDGELFTRAATGLSATERASFARFVPGGASADDDGAHHKTAEIGIKKRIEDKDFFGPGYSAPFNPHKTEFSLYLVHLFGVVAPLLECNGGEVVIDSGCGYSWTTEWMHRSGINAVGVDICRTYLEIAIERLGPTRPHLIVADVENLPIRSGCADAVLAYESFHHIPDRPRAVRGYSRVLKDGGRLVLAEPGAAHQDAPGSVEVMEKYGILEKGMELADVAAYAEGTAFGAPEQIFLVQAGHRDLSRKVVEVARVNSPVEGNIFRLRKGGPRADAAAGTIPAPAETADLVGPTFRSGADMSGDDERARSGVDLDATHFDAHYYANCCGRPYARDEEWLRFFGTIAERIATDAAPRRVLDAGCAIGLLVETLRARGIEAEGIDLSDYAIAQAHESVKPYVRTGSIVSELDGRYDVIVSIEVLEHMPPADAEAAVANFARHTDDIFFSSSPTDFGEATHVNVRPPEYWAELFARHGFIRDVEYDASFITPWAVRYRRRSEPLTRIVREYERAFARAAIERNELRAQVLRFDRDIITLATETPRLREQLASVNRQLHDTQIALMQAQDRIVHMERSFFWRLRQLLRG